MSGIQRLYELMENSEIETATIFGLSLVSINKPARKPYDPKKDIGCRKPLVKALLGKDPKMATRAIWKHIHSTLERIMELEGT